MVVKTVGTDPQTVYIFDGLAQSAIDFANEIGIDAGKLIEIIEVMTSPVDE